MAATPRVETAADVDCLFFSDSIGLFGPLFLVIIELELELFARNLAFDVFRWLYNMTLTLWAVKNCTPTKQDLRQFYKALTTNCSTVDRPTLGPEDYNE